MRPGKVFSSALLVVAVFEATSVEGLESPPPPHEDMSRANKTK